MSIATPCSPITPTVCEDLGYRLVSVSRLSEICNPFVEPPWKDVEALTVQCVLQAMQDEIRQPDSYSDGGLSKSWTVDNHIARIAHLAASGWSDPIEVDVGVPFLNCWVDWPVIDGNHRLAAAMVRGDKYILSSIAGSCDYMRERLGRFLPSATQPSHASPWAPRIHMVNE